MNKKVLLFDPTCLSYRIHVYNYFISEFKNYGINLKVYYDENKTIINNDSYFPIKYSFLSFIKLHRDEKPDISIYFIWLSYKWSLPFLIIMRLFMKTKSIVWSKGINIKNVDQPLKNILYYIRQFVADALILYSVYEKKFIKASARKVFIANNTINQYVYKNCAERKDTLKRKHGINHQKIVLFVGRIEHRKRLDLLIDSFKNELREYGLIIIGPGLEGKLQKQVNSLDNVYYFGPIYALDLLSEFYSMADIFCIPGHIGLAVNESFLYGLPVVTADIKSDPSLISSEPIMLLEDGVNGRFYRPEQDNLSEVLRQILENDEIRETYSKNAIKTFKEKAKIEYMAEGFLKAIKFVDNK